MHVLQFAQDKTQGRVTGLKGCHRRHGLKDVYPFCNAVAIRQLWLTLLTQYGTIFIHNVDLVPV